jgi:hypothetical protein
VTNFLPRSRLLGSAVTADGQGLAQQFQERQRLGAESSVFEQRRSAPTRGLPEDIIAEWRVKRGLLQASADLFARV